VSALSVVNPTPVVLPPADVEVLSLIQQLRSTAKTYRNCLAEISYYGWRLRYALGGSVGNKGSMWASVGYESEDAFRESLGIPLSTWNERLRIGQVLCNLSLEDLKQVKPTNARLLTQVDPAIVADFPWVEEAKTLSAKEFAQNVAKRNKQAGSDVEPTDIFKVRLPITAKIFLEDTVEKFRVEHELASTGEALEMLIADVHDRPNAMTTMKTAHDLIGWALSRVEKKWPESKEFQWLFRAKRILFDTYSAVRMDRPHEESKEEVYAPETLYGNKARPTGSGIVSTKPYGSDDPSKPGRSDSGFTGFHLHPLQDPDEIDGSDDGLEDGGE
jgi:hypothetical protein